MSISWEKFIFGIEYVEIYTWLSSLYLFNIEHKNHIQSMIDWLKNNDALFK